MKIRLPQQRNQGSVMLVTLFIAGFLLVALVAYLQLVQEQHRSVVRSQSWNGAFMAAEAGLEEALSHLNAVGSGNRATNGWTTNSSGVAKSVTLTGGELRYQAFISTAASPTVSSTGYARLYLQGGEVARSVQVTTARTGLFVRALTSRGGITMSGQFAVDSFDSTDPLYSTGGLYAVGKRKDNGDIGSMAVMLGAIDMGGQAKVYGSAAVTGGATLKVQSQAAVGSTSFVNGGSSGIQTGHASYDLNVTFPVVAAPTTAGAFPLPTGGTVGGLTYDRVFASQTYWTAGVSLSGQTKWAVTGSTILIVDKDFSQSGQSYVQILPGATLQLYVKAGSISISGQGMVNQTGQAGNLSIYGNSHVYASNGTILQKGLENISVSGNGTLIGTILAPDAALSLSGGGNPSLALDLTGAGVIGSVTGSGHFKVHYDEALSKGGTNGTLTVNAWKEL